jgi:hypothetical protein
MDADFGWLEPWGSTEDSHVRAGLEAQLALELGPRHVLYGIRCRLIARRDFTDDALFSLPDGKIAEVHMTWSKQMETDPRWPGTAVFASLEEWARERMIPLHQEWLADG